MLTACCLRITTLFNCRSHWVSIFMAFFPRSATIHISSVFPWAATITIESFSDVIDFKCATATTSTSPRLPGNGETSTTVSPVSMADRRTGEQLVWLSTWSASWVDHIPAASNSFPQALECVIEHGPTRGYGPLSHKCALIKMFKCYIVYKYACRVVARVYSDWWNGWRTRAL